MKTKMVYAAAFIVTSVVICWLMIWQYQSNEAFRNLFSGVQALAVQSGTAAGREGNGSSLFSFIMLLFTLILQSGAFFSALAIFREIMKSREPDNIRLIRLENADIFLDLPLYFGLFGTVLSFTVMAFNPTVSKLIAYSSTLIGIIISVLLRVTCQYPLRQKLLSAIAKSKGI